MPTYDFLCEVDKQSLSDVYLATREADNPSCPKCSKPMERILSLGGRHVGASAFPYVTKNIRKDGKPVEVTSEKHLQQLCKENGVTHRPDSAWLTKERLGYDWATKKQIYSEGSGRGLPGCWE
jgi:predicted nucleic acid-binding Zn ribbon protein